MHAHASLPASRSTSRTVRPIARTAASSFRPRALAVAVIAALGLGAVSPAFAADTPPTQPAGVSARLYGGSGGELFWQRSSDDRGVRGYEITLNGRNLGIRDALSYYDKTLKAGTRHDFTVAAVDTAGQRSSVARTTLGGGRPRRADDRTALPLRARRRPAPTAPVAGAPAAPAGLNAKVYSTSSAELFWTRPATPGLRYEIKRDGAVTKTTDGVSLYQSGLAAGRTYAYEIVAIDGAGKRSAPSRLSVNTTGQVVATPAPGTPATNPSAPATGTALAAPTGLRASLYSPKAGELFWTRPATAGLRYEISRDGAVVRTTDGVSHYDGALVAGKLHRYDIVAIDRAGKRSAAASVTLGPQGATPVAGTPTAPGTPAAPAPVATQIINAGNAEALLVEVFDRMAGNGYGDLAVSGFRSKIDGAYLDLDSYRTYGTVTKGTIDCAAAGNVAFELGDYGNSNSYKLSFNGCEGHNAVYASGSIDGSSVVSRGDYITATGRKFSFQNDRNRDTFDGSASTSADDVGQRTFGMTGNLTTTLSNRSVLKIENASVYRQCGTDEVRAPGSAGSSTPYLGIVHVGKADFKLTSPGTNAQPLTVRTAADFRHQYVDGIDTYTDAPWTFEQGRMTVTAEDGSRLDVDAGNGDPSTYKVTVTNGGRSTNAVKPIEPLMKRFRTASYCG